MSPSSASGNGAVFDPRPHETCAALRVELQTVSALVVRLNDFCAAHGLLPVCAGAAGLADAYTGTAASPSGPTIASSTSTGSSGAGASSGGGGAGGSSDGAAGSALQCVANACQAATARHFAGAARAPAAAPGSEAQPAVTVGSFIVCTPCPKRARPG